MPDGGNITETLEGVDFVTLPDSTNDGLRVSRSGSRDKLPRFKKHRSITPDFTIVRYGWDDPDRKTTLSLC
ncbi:Protein of unknown function [Pyronema omphalodes CBS 100304]|uniref:Uncharacterized protein n=1 Tax=Pyronema omphalodes (strain CBS 100304) TaxID=1076935 RepID=U4KTS9_PYROM|nr:Protein of unknown function [Pyronema omphalodes CBS 100304]